MITQIKKKITQIKTLGQSAIEYLVVLTVVLAVILSSGVRERISDAFNVYFTNAAGKIVTISPSP